jgi:O-antigen/teichoic acid export membrane protein
MFFRLFLRAFALGLKFGLAIVIARTLGFDAVGAYGLTVAVAVISSKMLGLGFSTEINRRLSTTNFSSAIREARRLFGLYGAMYIVLCAGVWLILAADSTEHWLGAARHSLLWLVAVAILEHCAVEANSCVFSLHRAKTGSMLLFVRTGAWASVAIGGLLAGLIRTIESVFALWAIADAVVIVVSWNCVWHVSRQAGTTWRQAPDEGWRQIAGIWKSGFPFYVGVTALSAMQYLERFIASGSMTSTELGRYVFEWSIANSVQSVASAAIVIAAGPAFVKALQVGGGDFRSLLRRTVWKTAGLTVLGSLAILVGHGFIFRIAREHAGMRELVELTLLLMSFVLRSVADVLWAAAVALRLGVKVAIAMIAIVAAFFPVARILIIHGGAQGAALAHLSASVAILVALAAILRSVKETETDVELPEASSHVA